MMIARVIVWISLTISSFSPSLRSAIPFVYGIIELINFAHGDVFMIAWMPCLPASSGRRP